MSHYQCSCGANVFGTGADHICTNAPRTVTGDNLPGNTVTIPYAEYQRLKALDVPAVQPVMAGTVDTETILRLIEKHASQFTGTRKSQGLLCTSGDVLKIIAELPIAAPVAPVTEREGFYEKLWRDFLSLQSGDIQLIGKQAERYVWLRKERSTLLLAGFFGNGCVNRCIEEVDAAIDAEVLAAAPTPPEAGEVKS